MYISPEAKRARLFLAGQLLKASQGLTFEKGKIFIHIYAFKPDHRSDAINVIDSIADVIKTVIGVDDRWFALAGVDYQVEKSRPRIVITVAQ